MVRPTKRPREEVSDSEVEKVKNLQDYRLTGMRDAEVFYVPTFVNEATAVKCAANLWRVGYQPKLKLYGREITQSRKIAAYATEPTLTLKYSGQVVDMKYVYPPLLRCIQDEVEERLGVKFNHVMLNLYEDGSVYIGNHRDNLENRVIASVSLGASRTFIMTHDAPKRSQATSSSPTNKRRKTMPSSPCAPSSEEVDGDPIESSITVDKKRWILEPGSLVVMQGDTQRFWKHEIPREPKVKEGRISLTFRQLVF